MSNDDIKHVIGDDVKYVIKNDFPLRCCCDGSRPAFEIHIDAEDEDEIHHRLVNVIEGSIKNSKCYFHEKGIYIPKDALPKNFDGILIRVSFREK